MTIRSKGGCVVAALVALTACETRESTAALETLPSPVRGRGQAMHAPAAQLEASWVEAVRVASDDFALRIPEEPAAAGSEAAVLTSLLDGQAASIEAAAHAFAIYEALEAAAEAGAIGMSDEDLVGASRQPLAGIVAVVGIGVTIALYKYYQEQQAAIRHRAEPVRQYLEGANDAELALFRESLGLDPSADHAAVIAAWDAQDTPDLGRQTNAMEALITLEMGSGGVRGLNAMELRQRTAESAAQAGAAGVKLSVSLSSTYVGTAGWGDAMRLLSQTTPGVYFSETQALAVDALATVLGWQPTDLTNDAITYLVVSEDTVPVDVDDPGDLSVTDAAGILDGTLAGNRDAAMARLAREAVGGARGDAPTRVHFGEATIGEDGETVLPLPAVGVAHVLVLSSEFPPQLHRVDTGADPHLIIDIRERERRVVTAADIPRCPPFFTTRWERELYPGHDWPLGREEISLEVGGSFGRFETLQCHYSAPSADWDNLTVRFDWNVTGAEDIAIFCDHLGEITEYTRHAPRRQARVYFVLSSVPFDERPVIEEDLHRMMAEMLADYRDLAAYCTDSPPP